MKRRQNETDKGRKKGRRSENREMTVRGRKKERQREKRERK
jgi:hypothetical protein